MILAAVFEIVHDLADDSAAPIGRDCRFEMNFAMGAIGASERIGDRAVERLRTLLAKWRNNPGGFCFALTRRDTRRLDICVADRAEGRIEKRCGRTQAIQTLRSATYFNQMRIIAQSGQRYDQAGRFRRACSFPTREERAFADVPPG